MDKITEKRINLLHPKIREEVKALINKANSITGNDITIRVVQGLRTFAEQDALYAQGRTKPGPKVTNAKGGQSWHNFSLAFDFAFLIKDKGQISWDTKKDWNKNEIADWMEVVTLFLKAGYEWGGTWKFKDYPHIQKTFGLSLKQVQAKYKNKDFIPNTNYINI